MKKWWKAVSVLGLIILLSGCILGLMSFIKDIYLQHSYELYSEPEEANGEKVKITFAWWGGSDRNKRTMQAIDQYEKKNPNIKIDAWYQEYEGYREKINVQLEASDGPDVFQFNPEDLGALVERGHVVPLDGFVQEGILDLSNIPESNLYEGKYEGQLYGIPMSIQTFCMIYNKYLFDLAGAAYPTDDWTWDDFETTLRELKEGLPEDVYPSGDLRSAEITTMLMIHQQGGSYLTPSGELNFQEEIRKPLELFQRYGEEGLVPPVEKNIGNSIDSQFVNEQVAIIATYNAMAQTLQSNARDSHEYGLVAIPESTQGDKLGTYVKGDLLLLINSHSDDQTEAAAFINALINDTELIETLGLSRGLPPSTKAQEQLEDTQGMAAEVFRLQRIAEKSNDVPEPRYIKGWSECIQIVDHVTRQYAFQKITLDEAVESMETQCEEILRQAGR
ncbi:MAG: extracellular solute-binding protein [Fusicatenibacter sp.]|nr:extracellular solute-binding protein [Fusicatenibacter sp.]